MPEVRKERSGWRDLGLSLRHKLWGWNCPANDIDFLMVEYDMAQPVGIVEYKNEHADPQTMNIDHPSMKAIAELANGYRAGIPFFFVRYTDDYHGYFVTPVNARARQWLPTRTDMTEREWVTLLYHIRGRNVPAEVWRDIADVDAAVTPVQVEQAAMFGNNGW